MGLISGTRFHYIFLWKFFWYNTLPIEQLSISDFNCLSTWWRHKLGCSSLAFVYIYISLHLHAVVFFRCDNYFEQFQQVDRIVSNKRFITFFISYSNLQKKNTCWEIVFFETRKICFDYILSYHTHIDE